MYTLSKYDLGNVIEYEFTYAGNYGAKGEKRLKKKKATPEQIKKQNQANKVKKLRREIEANFKEGDIWLTLTYGKDKRKSIEGVQKDVEKFTARLRAEYKKNGQVLKWVRRIEIGARGAMHAHMLINDLDGQPIAKLISKYWPHGFVELKPIDDNPRDTLAEYITKLPTESQLNMLKSLGCENEVKKIIRYSTSRNLVRPEPEKTDYSHRTMRSILNNPLVPTKGFYIDKYSIKQGINPFTGMSFLKYTERKLKKGLSPIPIQLFECPICHQFSIEGSKCNCQRRMRKRR